MPLSADCRALIDALSMPVFVVHGDGSLEWLNRRARQLLAGSAPQSIKSLLASPSQSDAFLRVMRRNQSFSHLALHLRAPLQDSYIASTRIAREGEFLDCWLLELLPRQLVVGGMHQLSQMIQRTTVLKRERAVAEKTAQLALTQASRDSLTGIANRRAFDECLAAALVKAEHQQDWLSVMIVDLDYFKAINDTHGHDLGDQVLKRVARLLTGAITRHGDQVARIGGEEFGVLLPGADVHASLKVAWRLVMTLRQYNAGCPAGDSWHPVTLSVGVATRCPDQSISGRDLMRQADRGLYLAKERGRDQAVHAVPSAQTDPPLADTR
ncbi:hypothetical protein A3724_09030 [Alcanivorax sp. HI0033]|uniref:sensor domain-containing diguanylate cyclase n=1 Tax=unclassified Alcanivorax TaxID=2638842 RepID=UPI0007B9A8F8|nr:MULTISPECIES: GGDEF domain-containing protein [unclassified Alcanivorax]KZX77204.1 hypothetical protein A3716_09190 [Alcanivorax sp. HI0011]KZX92401.1 hypothetical protein A3717_04035 [Alcanivorax sp. HI0013]KZY15405.1 hypothetical protein A3725_09690 [Alcanivorax sp. HI0035]KZX67297.1 hypothetical protein A3714_11075 [Alcanivorax sp. HI0007]KZX68527.1 hypothetical protein A3713_02030 [Alcanivorax sp. HI0003]